VSFVLVQVIVGGLLLGAVYALFSSGLHAGLGHDERRQLRPWRFRHARHVRRLRRLHGDGGRAADRCAVGHPAAGDARHYRLFRADPRYHEGADAGADPRHFGLALLLRYSVFWYFGANFNTLPNNLVGGTIDLFGIRIEASRLLAGVVALLVTLGIHLLLRRTSLGSKMLAVSEDSTAAQLMGIRPDTMQAIAWAIAAGATGRLHDAVQRDLGNGDDVSHGFSPFLWFRIPRTDDRRVSRQPNEHSSHLERWPALL
jgi:branched-chain amino acid transport system permease protein